MKNFTVSVAVILFHFSFANVSSISTKNLMADKSFLIQELKESTFAKSSIPIDSTIVSRFFKKYNNLQKYRSDVIALYKKRNYNTIWHDSEGLIEFSHLLYAKVNLLEEEGLKSRLAYKDKIDAIFSDESSANLSKTDTEMLLSTMYVFYAKKVYDGIDSKKVKEMGWFLPRKNLSYENLLDSLLSDPKLLRKNEQQLFGQYYKLRDVLKKYRQIEKNGGWNPIAIDSLEKTYKPSDSSKTIGQIRQRLAQTGDLKLDSKSNVYDEELMAGILNYKKRNGFNTDYLIASKHIQRMNIPIENYIKTIIANMERCRWIDPKLTKTDEYIIINIPSYQFFFKKNGQNELESKVFVGKNMNKTVVLSSNIDKIVFSPYWNIPKSIIENEIKYAIERDENYLEKHNIEWYKGNLRQKPGPKNSLGLVKFIFPNSEDIYLHDTPSKDLFQYEYRAYSHGCINIEKAKELALLILKDDPDWPVERINEAMKGEKETVCILKKKIPIHIGYFTAWVNDSGEISFYNDIYLRDDRLVALLVADDPK
ncbi:MAG TPA: L,D-transpeptidase family protein [Flavobacterium sp.]|uniref:L,D-transpeptidase family protein n=1 Tax=Flavobacterium sp. TaxID=239 RepID=UPI002C3DDF48|nr:L,D-transpeptidase family protein [Flavobacterium sp.]HRM46279.1 L,D-transpeptidase family protein [Flavobacterium sp.]